MTYEKMKTRFMELTDKYFPTKTKQDSEYVTHILMSLYIGVLYGVTFGIFGIFVALVNAMLC